MRIAGNSRLKFRKRLPSTCAIKALHSQRGVDLFPIDLAQQFLDAVFRAKDPDFNVLNVWRIRLVNKEVTVNVIHVFPSALLAIAEEQNISHAMAERII